MNLTKLFRKGFSTAASERTPFIVEEGNECKVKIRCNRSFTQENYNMLW